MNILIIGPSFLPIPSVEGGAIEGLVDEYLKYNSKMQHNNITVYSAFSSRIDYNYNKKFKNTSFRYIKKKGIIYKYYRFLLALKRRIIKSKQIPDAYCMCVLYQLRKKKELDKYDLVIVENQIESLIQYNKKIKSPIVEHLHNDYLNINTKCAKEIVNSCDEFWGVSNFICEQIKKIDSKVNTKVLYNGIEMNKFSRVITQEEKNKIYNQIGFSNNDFIITYVGRIMPEKGVLELVKAFNYIKKKNDNLKLLIVGGKKSNSEEINNYCNLLNIEKNKNSDSIFMYGKANINELINLYSITNLQVVPSLCEEAFGLVLLEGMCTNNPLIVTNSGGMLEVIDDKALIVNRGNRIIENLADAIMYAYNNIDMMNKKVKDYHKILSQYTIEKYCITFDNYIRLKN